MKIKDIISEGWKDIAKSAASKILPGPLQHAVAQSDWDKTGREQWAAQKDKYADLLGQLDHKRATTGMPAQGQPNIPKEGFVLLVRHPGTGQEYFKSYSDKWYTKTGGTDDFSLSGKITDPNEEAALDDIAHTGEYVPVKLENPADSPDSAFWVRDKAKRKKAK